MNVTAKPAGPVEMGTNPGQSWIVTPEAVNTDAACSSHSAACDGR